jgi:hypothetical protein
MAPCSGCRIMSFVSGSVNETPLLKSRLLFSVIILYFKDRSDVYHRHIFVFVLYRQLYFCLFAACCHVLCTCVCLLWSFVPVWHFAICLPCLFTKHSDCLSGRLLEWPQYLCLCRSRSEFWLFKVEVASSTLVNRGALRSVSRWPRHCNNLSRPHFARRHVVISLCVCWSSQNTRWFPLNEPVRCSKSTNSKRLVCFHMSQIMV